MAGRKGTRIDIMKRIRAKTRIEGEHWRFTGKKIGRGYGCIWYEGKTIRLGRLICHLYFNADLNDDSWEACHKDICRYQDCWNPDHLYVGTHYQNIKDQIRNNRFHFGTENLLGYQRSKGLK